MKKFIIGSALMLSLIVLGAGTASAYTLDDAKAKINGAQDKAEMVWERLNEIMDRAEAAGKDISTAEAYHADAEAKYTILNTEIDELLALIDSDAPSAEKKAQLENVKTAFYDWKDVMVQIKDKLVRIYAAHPAIAEPAV